MDNIKTDASIASIFQKLKEVSKAEKKKKEAKEAKENPPEEVETEDTEMEVQTEEEPIEEVQTEEHEVQSENHHEEFIKSVLLPWFTLEDKDKNNLHFMKFDNQNNIVLDSTSLSKSMNDLAALKLKSNFICEIDYYINKHYVLGVKTAPCDCLSDSFVEIHDNSDGLIEVGDVQLLDDSDNELESNSEVEDDEILPKLDGKYTRYTVFTDTGIAEFTTNDDDTSDVSGNKDLNDWFESTSNYTRMFNPTFTKNDKLTSEYSKKIKDFNYDIITLRRPGIISLDSVDNDDSNYQLNLKIKEEYEFIPIQRILGCLKKYSSDANKSISDFRKFINKYFEII